MSSKEIWVLLEKLTTDDIQVLITMSIRYLEKNRGIDFNSIIKDIKGARKYLDDKYRK